MSIINEGSVKLRISKIGKISKEMDVFYNPVMSFNRDISVLLLNSVNKKSMQVADPLAASGVRSIRFLRELNTRENKIKKIYINDYNKSSTKSIKNNLALNKIQYKKNSRLVISNLDANIFLLSSSGFDYIDIDPFGTPNPFLDAACKRISRDGILAATATDTSALCGTYPKACLRKYWAMPKRGAIMHEIGLRILIRKIQLVAAQYDKALIPMISYSKEHYMRVFLKNEKGKSKVDYVLKQHGCFDNAGPMWLGNLLDKNLCNQIYKNSLKNKIFKNNKELINFLKILKEESKINAVGFYDLNDISSKYKIRKLQKKDKLMEKIKKLGYQSSETHFKGEGIRSDISLKELIRILKN